MAPKRKAAVAEAAKAAVVVEAAAGDAAAAPARPGVAPAAAVVVATANETLYKQMTDDSAAIFGTEVFNGIVDKLPLAIGRSGGHQAPYSAEDYKLAMTSVGIYKCGFNVFMTNLAWSATPSIPLVEGRVKMLLDYHFAQPAHFPFELTIGVPAASFDPLQHKGGLQCISPEEIKMAFLRAIARDVEAPERLQEWRTVALTTSVRFKVLESEDDVFFEAVNQRERLVQDYEALARTAFQRIHEVVHFRDRKRITWGATTSHKKICEEFNKCPAALVFARHTRRASPWPRASRGRNWSRFAARSPGPPAASSCRAHVANPPGRGRAAAAGRAARRARLASTSEPINVDFVQKALLVHEKAFALPRVLAAIQALEAVSKRGPYDGLHKLAGIVKKAKDPPVIEWCFCTITDLVISKQHRAEDFAARWLLGDSKSGRGAVDTYILKFRMLEHMTTSLADQLGLPTDVKTKLREVLGSHENYRKWLHPIGVREDAGLQPDMTWRGGWALSSILYLTFVEQVVYSDDYDGPLRTAAKMGKGTADIIGYDSFAAKWGHIQETLRKEKEEAGQKVDEAGQKKEEEGEKKEAAEPGPGGEPDDASARLRVEAQRIVHSNTTIFVETESQSDLKSAIMSSGAGKIQGKDGSERPGRRITLRARRALLRPARVARTGAARVRLRLRYVLVVYDYKQACESKTNPQTRIAPLREARCMKSIVATLDARRTAAGSATTKIIAGDLYCLFDGSRSGNLNKLRMGFVDEEGQTLKKCERKLTCIYSEECAAKRRAVIRGTGSVKQQEGILLISRHKVKVPRRKRLHFDGTSAGDTFVNIPSVGPDEAWRLPLGLKKNLYAHHRVEVGGKGPESDSEETAPSGVEAEPPAKAGGRGGRHTLLCVSPRGLGVVSFVRSRLASSFLRARRSGSRRSRRRTTNSRTSSFTSPRAASWRNSCTWPTSRP
jgi:hypothetical protein